MSVKLCVCNYIFYSYVMSHLSLTAKQRSLFMCKSTNLSGDLSANDYQKQSGGCLLFVCDCRCIHTQIKGLGYQLMVREEDIITVPQACDDISNIANNGCKHQNSNEKICNHKQVLVFPFWERSISYCGENLCREPEAVNILAPQ